MYGLTRATTTLIAAAVAGLLIWFATQVDEGHRTATPSEPSPGASRKNEDGKTGRGCSSG